MQFRLSLLSPEGVTVTRASVCVSDSLPLLRCPHREPHLIASGPLGTPFPRQNNSWGNCWRKRFHSTPSLVDFFFKLRELNEIRFKIKRFNYW